jgi:hypothetical protein
MGIVQSIRTKDRKESQSMKENKFTIGYNVRIVGRLARLAGGLIPRLQCCSSREVYC